jgi:hypothetical protein
MSMRWFARFLAGGVAVAADKPLASPVQTVRIPVVDTGDRWIDRLARRGGNIAILAGLALIPIVAGTGFASDQELQFGAHVADAIAEILHRTPQGRG